MPMTKSGKWQGYVSREALDGQLEVRRRGCFIPRVYDSSIPHLSFSKTGSPTLALRLVSLPLPCTASLSFWPVLGIML